MYKTFTKQTFELNVSKLHITISSEVFSTEFEWKHTIYAVIKIKRKKEKQKSLNQRRSFNKNVKNV